MKRISILGILLIVAMAFLATDSFAYGEVIVETDGPAFIDANTIGYNFGGDDRGIVRFTIRFVNEYQSIIGFQNGFRIYSPDGAHWDAQPMEIEDFWDPALFPFANTALCYDCNGLVSDTFGIVGAGIGPGFPAGFDANVARVTIKLAQDLTNDGTTLCLDSVYKFGPTKLPWTWGLGDFSTVPPALTGGRCWDVVRVSDEPPESVECGEANGDPLGILNEFDVDWGVQYLFYDGPSPKWGRDTADVDDHELYTIHDLVTLEASWLGGVVTTSCPPTQPPLEPEVKDTCLIDFQPRVVWPFDTVVDVTISYYNDEVVSAFVVPVEILLEGQPLPAGSIQSLELSYSLQNSGSAKFVTGKLDTANNAIMFAGWRPGGFIPPGSWLLGEAKVKIPKTPGFKKLSLGWRPFGPSQGGQAPNYPILINRDREFYEPILNPADQYCCHVWTGNTDQDTLGIRDVQDILYLGQAVLLGTVPLRCLSASNIDGDIFCATDIGDLLWLVFYLFYGGPQTTRCSYECDILVDQEVLITNQ